MISVGIDADSATTKAVLVIGGQIISQNIRSTAFDFLSTSEMAHEDVLVQAEINEKDVDLVYATGYGRNSINFGSVTKVL